MLMLPTNRKKLKVIHSGEIKEGYLETYNTSEPIITPRFPGMDTGGVKEFMDRMEALENLKMLYRFDYETRKHNLITNCGISINPQEPARAAGTVKEFFSWRNKLIKEATEAKVNESKDAKDKRKSGE